VVDSDQYAQLRIDGLFRDHNSSRCSLQTCRAQREFVAHRECRGDISRLRFRNRAGPCDTTRATDGAATANKGVFQCSPIIVPWSTLLTGPAWRRWYLQNDRRESRDRTTAGWGWALRLSMQARKGPRTRVHV